MMLCLILCLADGSSTEYIVNISVLTELLTCDFVCRKPRVHKNYSVASAAC